MEQKDKEECGLCGQTITEEDKKEFEQGSSDPVIRAFELAKQKLHPGTVVRIYGAPLKAVDEKPGKICEFPYDSDDEDEEKCLQAASHVVSTMWQGEHAVCQKHQENWVKRHRALPADLVRSRKLGETR